MPASADDLRKGIAPGSVEHGQRQELEAGLAQATGGAPGTAPPPQALGQTAAGSPLEALLGGDINPNQAQDLPTTAGLSVGPGSGPYGEQEDPQMVKLRQAATSARSPELRQVARNELRRLVRENK